MKYLVYEAEAQPLTPEALGGLQLEQYGYEWVIVEAADEQDALSLALLFDRGLHPAQTEMTLFREQVQALVASGNQSAALDLILH